VWLFLIITSGSAISAQADSIYPVCGRSHRQVLHYLRHPVVTLFSASGSEDLNDIAYRTSYFPEWTATEYRALPGYLQISSNSIQSRFHVGLVADEGDWGVGLCWWHSRFLRAVPYLVDFDPGAPKPTAEEAKTLLRRVTRFQPVVLPGFEELRSFLVQFQKEFYAVLSEWQRRTTRNAPQYALSAPYFMLASSKFLERETLDSLDRLLLTFAAARQPIYITLPLSDGMHSMVVVDYRIRGKDVSLKVYDSNNIYPVEWKIIADGRLDLRDPTFFDSSFLTLKTDFMEDFREIEKGLRTVCGPEYRIPRE
jgi:hypothetical protein